MTALGLIIVRLTVGATFVAHGLHKLFGIGGGQGVGAGGLDQTAAQFSALGLSPAFPLGALAGATQLAGGILLLSGLLTRWAALALIAYCAIGIWADHGRWGFFLNWLAAPGRGHGIEYMLVLMGALGCLLVMGGGDWSLDGRRARSVARTAAGRARLRRG